MKATTSDADREAAIISRLNSFGFILVFIILSYFDDWFVKVVYIISCEVKKFFYFGCVFFRCLLYLLRLMNGRSPFMRLPVAFDCND